MSEWILTNHLWVALGLALLGLILKLPGAAESTLRLRERARRKPADSEG